MDSKFYLLESNYLLEWKDKNNRKILNKNSWISLYFIVVYFV